MKPGRNIGVLNTSKADASVLSGQVSTTLDAQNHGREGPTADGLLPASDSPARSMTPVLVSDQDLLGSIALDQWRGLALVLVLISHGFFFTNRVNGIGRVGVNLFLFISGILVFRSLCRIRVGTWAGTGCFWWRRFRRLYPALLSYSVAMLVAIWWLQWLPHLPPLSDFQSYLKALPVALLCGTNYDIARSPMALSHLWCLACIMQFFIIAPLIYALGGAAQSRRRLVFGSVLLILIGLGASQPLIGKWKYHFEFAAWPMMLGFCCEYQRSWLDSIPRKLVTLALWLSIAICGMVMVLMLFGMETKVVVIAVGALLLAPCLLAYQFGRPVPGLAGRALKWLGERTYSIYLWQQPFTICNFLLPMLHPVGAIVSVGVGGAWFHFFERPFLSASRRK